MGVYIKDMEMPKTCEDCQFHRYHSHYEYVCVATPLFYPMNLANSEGIRKDWCPLVSVPKPHGRLIDADKFNEFIEKHCTDSLSDLWKELVRRQPPVIEAEGE